MDSSDLSKPEGMEDENGIPMNTDACVSQTSSRLMITKMVLENFKSYAGVKEIGPFHKCFSAVVGPNGSGKSNVIDAMLFVFGKRAKKLRLNKVSELIHKSDAVAHDPPQYARVSVYFQEIIDTGDGDEDYEVIPNTDMVVTRMAKTDNSSTYKLNGKNSSFKEIANYLNSKGIDLDNNRFLILQGEVEMISMMPPKGKTENDEGLLEYLEDIIGSSKFVEATNEAAEKVDSLTEARQEKLNRVKAVEKEKDNLEGAKQEAEALLAKEREIRRKQSIMYQIHAMKAQKEFTKLTEKRESVTAKLELQRKELGEASTRIDEIESGLAAQRKDYNKTFEALKKTKEEFTAFERKDIKLREEISHEKTQKKKLEDKIKAETKKESTAANKIKKANDRIPELENEIEELKQKKTVESAKLDELEEESRIATQEIRRDLEAKTQELAPVKQERSILQAALDTAVTELKILEDGSNRAKERLLSAESELADLDNKKSSKSTEYVNVEKEVVEKKDKIVALQKEDSDLENLEGALGKHHEDVLAQVEDLRSAMRSVGGKARSKAVKGILKAASKGGELSKVGVLGRLGDLATIQEKYDIAVSTACGGMLDNIVVQTTAGAQRCLEFLRKYDLGRASFIPLDKMKKGAHDRAVETPENAPRLFDLITPSNFAVTPALFLAVGNTLVAPDMDTATRWAYEYNKRWRVVTLNGNLIETTGTMSGGGKTARSGGMRLSNGRTQAPMPASEDESEKTIETLELKAKEMEATLKECSDRRREIKGELKSLAKAIKSLEIKLPKLKLEIDGCETTREELTKLIPELRVQSEVSPEDQAQRTELKGKVQKCKNDMSACSKTAEKLEKEVAKLQQNILDAGGKPLKDQKSLCAKINADLKGAEKALSSAKMEIKSAEKAEQKARSMMEDYQQQLGECESQLAEKEAEFETLQNGANDVMHAFEEVKKIEAEKRTALEGVSKEVEELKKAQSEIRCLEIDLLGQIEALEKQLSENKKKQKHWEKEIKIIRKQNEEFDFDFDDEDLEAEPSNENEQEKQEVDDSMDVDNEGKEANKDSPDNDELPYSVLERYDADEIKDAIAMLQTERDTLAKNANMGAIDEYRKKESDYLARVAELDKVTEERNDARKEHEELRRQRLEMFMDGFGTITLKLKEMYQMITLGGDAELELVDSLDPFSEGIVFSVRPPKKSWKNISNLSGGEKTLSSLSLVFALHHYKPTPLYVMDEIDAALDFKNVSIVANYIKERTKNAQFIIISLRNNMFELADRLVGIYKTQNCTKSVTINPRAFGNLGQQNGASRGPLANTTNTTDQSLSSSKHVYTTESQSSSQQVV